jgi:PAS domain S-box-containing protein
MYQVRRAARALIGGLSMKAVHALKADNRLTLLAGRSSATSHRLINRLQTCCQAFAAAALALALINLCGWVFHIAIFTSVIPGHVTMKVNTALYQVLASISLWLLIPGSTKSRANVSRILAVLLLLFAATTLGEYLFHVNLGIDQLWVHDRMSSFGTTWPGRPAPTTALAYIAVALALLLLGSKKTFAPMLAQIISLFPMLISWMALERYIYHAVVPYRLFFYAQVAIPTATGLLLLSSSIFFLRPRTGIATDFAGAGPGSLMARRFLPAIFIIPVLFGWICLHGQMAGLYAPELTPALNATMNTIAFAVLMWSSARQMNVEHEHRSEAENEISRLNVDLESRVAERTITLQRQAKLLTEQATLLDLAQDAIIVRDLDDRISFWNHGAEEMYGWSSQEAIGQPLRTLLQVEASEPANTVQAKLLLNKEWEGEAVHHKRDGSSMVVASRCTVQYDADGVVVQILVINNDITARKRAGEVLRQSEENLRLLFQGVKDYAILSLDEAGRITSWNEGAQRIKGYSSEEIIGQHFSKFYTPEAVAADQPSEELRIAAEQGRFEEEGWRVRKDGSQFWASVIISALRDQAGELRGFAKVTRDITARKKAQSENLSLTERLSLATSVAKIGVWEWDLANDSMVWDATMFEIYGIPAAAGMTYEKWAATVHPEDRPAVEDELRKVIVTKGKGAAEYRIIRPDGSARNVSAVENVSIDEHSTVIRVVGVNVDVTERKLAEAAREQSGQDQLKFKDDFLSQVSHELRSPLTAIKQFTSIILDGLAGEINAEQRKYQEIVLKNSVQLQSMIDDLLEVTRVESGKLSVVPECILATNAITDVFDTFRERANEKEVALSFVLPRGLPQVYADPTRLRQILIVLVDNAIKFTPSGGVVKIQAQRNEADADTLLLEVSDTGNGIDPEATTKIFERLYQVSGASLAGRKGLGLGLFICKELVTRQGGNIWVKSKLGKGTTFSFTLPIFSLKKLIAPFCKNEKWPAKHLALLTVEIGFPLAFSNEARERWSMEARRIVQLCLSPNLNLLFPQKNSEAQREQIIVAAFTGKVGAAALAAKIGEQLKSRVDLEGMGLSVSFTMLNPPVAAANAPTDTVVAGMAAYFEESIKSKTVVCEVHYA